METDAAGRFRLAGLAGETARLVAWLDGHRRNEAEGVTLGSDDIRIRLDRLATIRGRLVDEAGQPLAGSAIGADADAQRPILEFATGSEVLPLEP